MSLCPAADYRASLSDAEFWEHVLLGGVQVEDNYYDGDDDPTADELHPVNEWGTCPWWARPFRVMRSERGRRFLPTVEITW